MILPVVHDIVFPVSLWVCDVVVCISLLLSGKGKHATDMISVLYNACTLKYNYNVVLPRALGDGLSPIIHTTNGTKL